MVRAKHVRPAWCCQFSLISLPPMYTGVGRVILPFCAERLSCVKVAHSSNDSVPVARYSYAAPVSGSLGSTQPEIGSLSASSDARIFLPVAPQVRHKVHKARRRYKQYHQHLQQKAHGQILAVEEAGEQNDKVDGDRGSRQKDGEEKSPAAHP